MELDEIRAKIDGIDGKIIKLFEERMECAKEVAEYKRTHDVPVLQAGREEQVVAKAQGNITNPQLRSYAPELMNCLMELSKDYQRRSYTQQVKTTFAREDFDLNASKGFFGERGSNTERATREYFGGCDATSFTSFEDIFEAVSNGDIKYGV
ncbi:MAG: chorismate mutase, partial [Christensenellales bacterium]